MSNPYQKWLAFGAGVGIEIGERDLSVALVRVRPSGARIRGALTIERFGERPAAEWGAEYASFLREHGSSHLAATVLLPRREVIVRQIAMPGVSDQDLAQAVRFQLDGLHPYAEEDAFHDFARIGKSANVLIGITRREVVDRYVSLFAEAGIKVACLTFSAAVMWSGIRLFGHQPAGGFIAVDQSAEAMEVYGESESRPVFSANFETPNDRFAARARSLALAELRLPALTEPRRASDVLPAPLARPQSFELEPAAMLYATALTGACPHLALKANLLPVDLRVTTSRMMYVPSVVLGALLLIGFGGLALYGSWEDRKYLESLQTEIRRLEPQARRPMAIDRAIAQTRQRTQLLDGFRKRTQSDLDVLNELTKLVAPPGWLQNVEITRDQVRLSGEADQATGLLQALDKSPLFEASDFALPLARTGTGEMFSIRTRREGALP